MTDQKRAGRPPVGRSFGVLTLAVCACAVAAGVAMPFAPSPGAVFFPPAPPPADPPVPVVTLRVRVPAEAEVGQEVVYRLTAENPSRAAAHHVTVRVTVPGGARLVRASPEPAERGAVVTWKLGTLPACAKKEISLVLVAGGPGDLACCARVQFEHGQCVVTRLRGAGAPPFSTAAPPPAPPPPGAAPELRMRLDGPKLKALYDIVPFRLVLTNAGRATARSVVVEDVLPRGLSVSNSKPALTAEEGLPLVWEVGDVPPGVSRVLEYDVIAKDAGVQRTRAVARAKGGFKAEVRQELQVVRPALAVVKVGPKKRLVGRPAVYTITLSNPGAVPLTHVELSDELPLVDTKGKPSGLEFVSASDGGRLEGNHVRWDVGTLAPGERQAVQLTVKSKQRGAFKNVCHAKADRDLREQAVAKTDFEDRAALAVEIDRDRDPLVYGQEATVTLTCFNGTQAGVPNLSAVLTLPAGLRLLQVVEPAGSRVIGQQVVFPVARDFPAGQERRALLRVRAVGMGVQRIEARGTTEGGEVRGEETITVVPAGQPAGTSRLAPGRPLRRASFTAAEGSATR
jgi:uncharacterized repeat protein (TIGR01451 family)